MVELSIEKKPNDWTLLRLSNGSIELAFLNYGCIITELNVPDKYGEMENIVLSYNSINDYKKNPFYFGAVIGRVAGRIKDAIFNIGEQTHSLDKNEFPHHLHGGYQSLHQKIWDYRIKEETNALSVVLTTKSSDGENGYPGNVFLSVTYTLTCTNEFTIKYEATTDQTTPIALTNHTYFNLSGNRKETVENHKIEMMADRYLSLDDSLIATDIETIQPNSSFDFKNGKLLKDRFTNKDGQLVIAGNGYDHYFMFSEDGDRRVSVSHPSSGRKMIIKTNEPGLVMYTSNMMNDEGKLKNTQTKNI